jgi:hypothetical protein
MTVQRAMPHALESSTLADILERVLDKGVVIAGDIKIKLVDIELLTIQIRLVICSVERAKEMGMDWWETDPNLSRQSNNGDHERMGKIQEHLTQLEEKVAKLQPEC